MAIVKDIIGLKFGKLTILSISNERGNKNQIRYNCLCDCGSPHITSGDSIRGGKSKSCGCNRKEPPNKNIDRVDAIWKQIYNSTIIKRSKKSGIKTDITLNDFIFLSKKCCFYCGLSHSNTMFDRCNYYKKNIETSSHKVEYNGIDRLDSKQGYTKNNTVSCCKYCNTAKNTMSIVDFLVFIKRIYDYSIVKKQVEILSV